MSKINNLERMIQFLDNLNTMMDEIVQYITTLLQENEKLKQQINSMKNFEELYYEKCIEEKYRKDRKDKKIRMIKYD